MRQHPERNPKREQGGDQRSPADGVLLLGFHKENHKHAHEREEGQKSKRL